MGGIPRKYEATFKAEVLAYMDATDLSATQVAEEFGIAPTTLKTWSFRRDKILSTSAASATNAYKRGWIKGRKAAGKPIDMEENKDGHELIGPLPETMIDTIQRSEVRKLQLMTKVEDAVEAMVQRLMEEVEHADFSQLVDAINTLLDRIEAMTYRPRAENREDFIAMMSGLQPTGVEPEGEADDSKLELAVVEALKRRGHLGEANGSTDGDS